MPRFEISPLCSPLSQILYRSIFSWQSSFNFTLKNSDSYSSTDYNWLPEVVRLVKHSFSPAKYSLANSIKLHDSLYSKLIFRSFLMSRLPISSVENASV